MEIKKQVILRSVANEHILIPVGETVYQYNGLFQLTESGKMLWNEIVNGQERNDLIDLLMKEYGIDCKTATDDVDAFLQKLKDFEII